MSLNRASRYRLCPDHGQFPRQVVQLVVRRDDALALVGVTRKVRSYDRWSHVGVIHHIESTHKVVLNFSIRRCIVLTELFRTSQFPTGRTEKSTVDRTPFGHGIFQGGNHDPY